MKPPMLDCKLSEIQITVGKKIFLECPMPTLITGAEKLEWVKPNTLKNYELVFLGTPKVENGILKQEITSYKVGDHVLSKVQMKIGGETLLLNDFQLKVQSVLPPPAPVKEGEQQAPEPTPFPNADPETLSAPWWWWVMWIVVAVIVIGFVYRRIKQWVTSRATKTAKVPVKVLSVREKFILALQKLESQEWHSKGEYKRFALELTAILKKSTGEKFKFNAEDLTTEEFFEILEKKHSYFWRENQDLLKQVFEHLDQIKFAKVTTTPEICMALIDKTRKVGNNLFRGDQ